jgi:ribonucleotide reductase beta subunit family protein with ferritin-like domain
VNPVQFKLNTKEETKVVQGMTVFNQNQVDTKKQPMFFGQPLGVQRYDSYKYPIFERLTTQQLGYFWRPEEVSLQKDRADYQTLRPEQKHIFTSNLKYQVMLDRSSNDRVGIHGNDSLQVIYIYYQECLFKS